MAMRDQDRMSSLLTRRAFMGWAGKGVGVFVLAGVIRLWGSADPVARPPGAVPEEQFLALCVKCQRCAESCPYGAIRPVRITESLRNAGTPVMQGLCWRGHCQLNCISACRTGALQ